MPWAQHGGESEKRGVLMSTCSAERGGERQHAESYQLWPGLSLVLEASTTGSGDRVYSSTPPGDAPAAAATRLTISQQPLSYM